MAPLDDVPYQARARGGTIVAEVFAAQLVGDRTSYLNTNSLRVGAPFTPIPGFTRDGTFGLAQLINVALERAA